MYWILFLMAAIVAVVVAVIVGGLVTPRDHAVARAVVIPATPDAVWATIRDFARYDEWRDELERTDVVDAEQPQPRWRETSTRGSVTFGVTHEDAPRKLVVRILDDDLPFSGEWTWELRADGTGTRVTIIERGSVPNPVFRFVAAHFMGYTRSLNAYLRALARRHHLPDAVIVDATL